MAKYKLKKEARQFFSEHLGKEVNSLEFWEKKLISKNLLDEVDKVYIEYGIDSTSKKSTTKSRSLCALDHAAKLGEFRFTLVVTDMIAKEYSDVNVAELMDALQKTANKFFK